MNSCDIDIASPDDDEEHLSILTAKYDLRQRKEEV
jgi:hypothetical protein